MSEENVEIATGSNPAFRRGDIEGALCRSQPTRLHVCPGNATVILQAVASRQWLVEQSLGITGLNLIVLPWIRKWNVTRIGGPSSKP